MKLIISLFAVTLLGQIEPGQYPQNAGSGGSCSTLGGVLSGTCTTATFTAPNAANGPVVLDGSGNASFPGNVAISNTLLGIQIATPANPLAGTTYLYPKTGTNVWCSLSPTGVETCMGSGALPGTVVQTNQVNTYGAFLQDFSAGTVKLPALTGTQITTGLTTTGPDFEVGLTSDTVNRVAIGLNSTDIPRLSFGPGGSTARDLFLERAGPATQRWGAPDAAAPVAQTIGVQNVVTGTSNTAGALTTFIGSKSTGSAAGGGFAWQVSPAGGSGTAVNSLVTAMTLTPVGLTTIEPMTLPNEIALAASSATDSASLGPELTTSGTCSGTGWTGTYPNYVAPGTTAPLTCTGFTSGSFYQTVTVIGVGGSGSVTIAIGTAQTASGASGTVTAGLKANGTSLTYTPASSYTGTITISAKLITPISTFSYLGKDSTGASSFKALYQTLGSLNNSFQGGGGTYNTTGYNNSAQGYNALYFNTTGSSNLAQGYNALYFNTTGIYNSAQGYQALYYNTTGSYNSAQGYNALYSNTTGNQNSAQGQQALYSNTTGYYNSAQGVNAIYSNTTGYYNSAQGGSALYSNTTGSSNSAQGVSALYSNTTGSYNTAQGLNAGYTATTANANTTGSYNTWIGNNSGPGVVSSSSLQNATAIGNGALNMASNQVVLGNASVTDVYLGSATANATTHESSAVVINPTATTGSSTLYLGYDNSGTYTGAHTSATTTKLQVYGGQSQTLNTGIGWFTNAGVRIGSLPTDAVGHGIILTDSAGACWQIVPSSTTGFVTSTSVTCP